MFKPPVRSFLVSTFPLRRSYDVHAQLLTDDSYETVFRRWPIIITNIIDHVHRLMHDMTMESQQLAGASSDPSTESNPDIHADSDATLSHAKMLEDKVKELQEGKDIIVRSAEDGDVDVDLYNVELAELEKTGQNLWFTAPWLFAECYLYRLIRSYFSETRYWRNFDPFFTQKEQTFKNSATAIFQIATMMHKLERDKDLIRSNQNTLFVVFQEMVQMCLWGNATDLSLLTNLTAGRNGGSSDGGGTRLMKIGRNSSSEMMKMQSGNISKILEDRRGAAILFWIMVAGFELFTDLVFADFLVTYTPYFSKVVFHPKLFPWFVSDVTPTDFESTFTSLLSPMFFPPPLFPRGDSVAHLEQMVTRWKSYIEQGIFVLSTDIKEVKNQKIEGQALVKFWTEPWPYWNMNERASLLWQWLHESDLVIFKGDLNYRKLTGDVKWPVSTSFSEALGPLAGSFPLLSLRTNKADVAVGIPQGVADELDDKGEKWRVSGK
ncbi:DUF89 domain-containing protein [Chiua virens]|nr:DUF89 domain-containing protein [Chiua virens]